jgi:hypothetical protein
MDDELDWIINYGIKYRLRFIDHGTHTPRFVTAYPLERKEP